MDEEIDLGEYLAALRRRAWVIVLVTTLTVAITAGLSFYVLPKIYEASVSLIVIRKETPLPDYNTLLLNRQLVKTYQQIARSRTVASKVITQLGLDMQIEDLQEVITVRTVRDTEMIEIAARDTDPEMAAALATAVTQAFIEEVLRIMQADNVAVVDPAVPPVEPIRPRPLLNTAVAGVLGLMTGTFLAFVVDYLDKSIKRPEDVEKWLALPVLGVIPEIRVHEERRRTAQSTRVGEVDA